MLFSEIKETPAANSSSAPVEKRRSGSKRRISKWAKGATPARKKRHTPNATPNDNEGEEDEDNDEEEEMEEESNNDLITTGVRLDQNKLNGLKSELIKFTKEYSVERLERVYTRLIGVVDNYKNKVDRSQLPGDLQVQIETLKSNRLRNN